MSANDKQVGGSHYKDFAIQPVEFITRNNLGFLEGCVIKRMCRWQAKGGAEDLRKAIHEIELLIEAQPAQVVSTPKPRMRECPRCDADEGDLCRDWDNQKNECPGRFLAHPGAAG